MWRSYPVLVNAPSRLGPANLLSPWHGTFRADIILCAQAALKPSMPSRNIRAGRSGYALACANEWQRGVCEKPKVKCSACPNQAFRAVDDVSIERHLRGVDANGASFVMGIYPMLALADRADFAITLHNLEKIVALLSSRSRPSLLSRSMNFPFFSCRAQIEASRWLK